jgi:gluconate 5-dehydrogenase
MSLMSVKDLFDLTGRVALVTGGSRGLGLDMAIGLGEAGAAVMITARREQWLTTAEAELLKRGVSCATAVCDVSNPAQVEATVKATLDAFGRLDVVVNNAGISWETNATGCFLVSQAAGRELVRAGRGGSIINIASVAGLGGLTADVLDAVGYSASKGAIVALTKDLAVKWAPHDIRVNAIAPGFFDTRLSHSLLEKTQARVEKTTPMGRIGKPGELSGVAVFLASAASSYITGQVLAVDGGMTA